MSDATHSPKRRSGTEARQRTGVIGFRATPAERAALDAAADRVGLSLGSYIRARALAEPTTRATRRPPVDRTALAQLLGQIGRVGSNLNQIARSLNSGDTETPGDLAAALTELHGMKDALMAALGRGRS
jgi:hypothetical protein